MSDRKTDKPLRRPALIVGLGGSGVRILRMVLWLAESGGDPELARQLETGRLRLLGIDTDPGSDALISAVDGQLAPQTQPITGSGTKRPLPRLGEGRFLLIGRESITRELKAALKAAKERRRSDADPATGEEGEAAAEWLPLPQGEGEALFNLPCDAGTAHWRPLGRIALFSRAERVLKALRDGCTGLGGVGARPVVYLTGALSGGTGGGMFWDVAMMLRTLGHPPAVVGAFLLPSELLPLDRSGRALANTFAALKELVHFNFVDGQERQTVRWPGGTALVRHGGEPPLFKRVMLYRYPLAPLAGREQAAALDVAENLLVRLKTEVAEELEGEEAHEGAAAAKSRLFFGTSVVGPYPLERRVVARHQLIRAVAEKRKRRGGAPGEPQELDHAAFCNRLGLDWKGQGDGIEVALARHLARGMREELEIWRRRVGSVELVKEGAEGKGIREMYTAMVPEGLRDPVPIKEEGKESGKCLELSLPTRLKTFGALCDRIDGLQSDIGGPRYILSEELETELSNLGQRETNTKVEDKELSIKLGYSMCHLRTVSGLSPNQCGIKAKGFSFPKSLSKALKLSKALDGGKCWWPRSVVQTLALQALHKLAGELNKEFKQYETMPQDELEGQFLIWLARNPELPVRRLRSLAEESREKGPARRHKTLPQEVAAPAMGATSTDYLKEIGKLDGEGGQEAASRAYRHWRQSAPERTVELLPAGHWREAMRKLASALGGDGGGPVVALSGVLDEFVMALGSGGERWATELLDALLEGLDTERTDNRNQLVNRLRSWRRRVFHHDHRSRDCQHRSLVATYESGVTDPGAGVAKRLASAAIEVLEAAPRFTPDCSGTPSLYYEARCLSVAELEGIDTFREAYLRVAGTERPFLHLFEGAAEQDDRPLTLAPPPEVSCGNGGIDPGCGCNITGLPRNRLICPDCKRPIRTRCGNDSCPADDIDERLRKLGGETPPRHCPVCHQEMLTYWWYCDDPAHRDHPISTDERYCPRCQAERLEDRRLAEEVRQWPASLELHCPGCRTLNVPESQATRLPQALRPFYLDGVRERDRARFEALVGGLHLDGHRCPQGRERHYLFPTCPGGEEARASHLFRNDLGRFTCPDHPRQRFHECFHCGYPVDEEDPELNAAGEVACPRCRRILVRCGYCGETAPFLVSPERRAPRGRPHCSRCGNHVSPQDGVDALDLDRDYERPASCSNLFGCGAAADPWHTATDLGLIHCRVCSGDDGPVPLRDRARLVEQVERCPLCLTLVGLPRPPTLWRPQPSGELLPYFQELGSERLSGGRSCSMCGTYPDRVLGWLFPEAEIPGLGRSAKPFGVPIRAEDFLRIASLMTATRDDAEAARRLCRLGIAQRWRELGISIADALAMPFDNRQPSARRFLTRAKAIVTAAFRELEGE